MPGARCVVYFIALYCCHPSCFPPAFFVFFRTNGGRIRLQCRPAPGRRGNPFAHFIDRISERPCFCSTNCQSAGGAMRPAPAHAGIEKVAVMNLSELFIKRPITTTLIMLGIAVFGVMSYTKLPVSDLPVIDFPTIQVQGTLPGASPESVASSVALPLEKQFSSIAGLNAINSVSSLGSTNITLQFDLDRNIDAAAQDVQAMIAKAQRQLPPQMPTPPSYQKVNPADTPVLFLAFRSATLPIWV